MIRRLALAAATAALAVPVMAQEWHARATPLTPGDEHAGPVCHISSGEVPPLVAFTFERERSRFGVRASEFLDRSGVHQYSGALPSGATLTVSMGSDASSDVAVLTVDRARMLRFLEHFLVAGDFSLTGEGVRVEIPALPTAAGEMERLQNCLRLLDNG